MAKREIKTSTEFEFDGFWWEPGSGGEEPEQVQGRLRYEPDDGATLIVVDWHPNTDFFDDPKRVPVIHGKTLDDKPCSLFDAFPRDSIRYGLVGGHSREEWHSNQLIYGAHAHDPAQFEVQRVQVEIRGLRDWLGQHWYGPGQGRRGLTTDASPIEVPLDGAKLLLALTPSKSRQRFEEHHEIRAWARFELEKPLPLPEFKERYSGPLHDLLVFATHEETRIEGMTSLVPEKVEKWWGPEDKRTIDTQREIEIVQRTEIQPLTPRKRPYEHMLMPWAVLGKGNVEPIKRWFDLRAELAGAGDALFATINVRFIYLENQLLNLTSFAEAYHRVRHGKKQTQEKRLKALFKRAEGVLEEAKPWRKRLLTRLVATRNYLTHWSKRGDVVLAERDRWLAVVRLRIVIEINLLLDLGLDEGTVGACIRTAYMGHQALREKV